jgi:hypothetical protein
VVSGGCPSKSRMACDSTVNHQEFACSLLTTANTAETFKVSGLLLEL